jgi:raffinose/stachyose/melibiose transport system substrate-binding protein
VEQEYQKDASNVIKVKFASGDVPDITTVYAQDYVDQGKYLDLSNEAFWSRVLPAIKELNTDIKTGKQFRVATNVTMAGIFYNKKVFDELGLKEAATWDEFKANLQAIKERKPEMTPMFLAGKDSWTLGHLIEFMAHGVIKQQYGVTDARKAFINNESEKLQFDAKGGSIDSFAGRLLELKEAGLINKDALTATYDNQKEAFVTGKSALFSQGMWVLGDLLKLNPDMASDIGFSPFPAIVDGTQPVTLSAEDSVYAITSESKHPEEAKLFLEFLFRPENLKTYSEFLKSPPAFTDVSADWGPLKDQAKAALENGINIAFTETPAGFSGDDAGRMVQELLAGKYASSSEFANAYKEAWDKAWGATNK